MKVNGKAALCLKLETTGPVPLKHLQEDVFSRKDKKCQACGVCEPFLESKSPVDNLVPIASASRIRKEVRPAKHNRLHRKMIAKTVSVGIGCR